MLDQIKAQIDRLQFINFYKDDLLSYVNNSWQEIISQGKEYRLYNILLAMGTLGTTDDIKTLVEYITSGSDDKWAIVETYCYDFYVLNDMLLA